MTSQLDERASAWRVLRAGDSDLGGRFRDGAERASELTDLSADRSAEQCDGA